MGLIGAIFGTLFGMYLNINQDIILIILNSYLWAIAGWIVGLYLSIKYI
jgi:hypothetical protein